MKNLMIRLDEKFKFQGKRVLPSACVTYNQAEKMYLSDDDTAKKTIFANPPSQSVDDLREPCFYIENPNQSNVALWAVDGCFVGTDKALSKRFPKKCDCIFGFDQYLAFIEFRLEADPSVSPKAMAENRVKACQKIGSMIDFLTEAVGQRLIQHFPTYEIEAYLCTPPTYPSKNTSVDSLRIEFLRKYGIELVEKSEKILVL